MLRLLVRLLGVLLLAGAFAALVIDGTRSIAANAVVLTPLSRVLQTLLPTRFPQFEPAVLAHAPAWVWDPLLVRLLALPSALVVGLLGVLLLLATGRRRPQIGYARR